MPRRPPAFACLPGGSSTPSARCGPEARAGESEILASCYRRSIEVADRLGAKSVAFPAISTGIYGYPPELAAKVAVSTITSTPTTAVELVRLMAFDHTTLDLYVNLLGT